MGMTCTLYRVPSSDIDALVSDPASVRRLMSADDEKWTETKPGGCLGLLLRFTPLSIESATRKEPMTPEELDRIAENECDLEGVWQGLHFIFTGTAWEGDEPACYLVQGGEPISDDDFDQPPRLLRPGPVRDFNGFLAALSDDEVQRRYDAQRMIELKIDPVSLWSSPSAPDELRESLDELRDFTSRTTAAGDALIVHLG